jgi:hypothetical protein
MRKLVSLLLASTLALGALAPAVYSAAEGTSEKWCRNHKKKCKKLLRRTRQGTGLVWSL